MMESICCFNKLKGKLMDEQEVLENIRCGEKIS